MLNAPLLLPCGTEIKNRLVKAATTERLSDKNAHPTDALNHLYRRWADTGAGLLITGNVMTDPSHMESAGNVVIQDRTILDQLSEWAAAGKQQGNQVWVQVSHSGRQTSRFVNRRPLAPSEVQLQKMGLFGKPRAMSEKEIEQVIEGFVRTAVILREAGFTGVQIHAAHGYLLSQFLSPRTNLRGDSWGGSLQNRSRMLLRIVRETREAVGPAFPVSVKLNSADFQRGAFAEEESLEVVRMLDAEGIDMLEISGGTYERLAFFLLNEPSQRESTSRREAYFIDYARKVREITRIPLMITGGFRTRAFCEQVLESGEVDLIGMARPFILQPGQIPGFLNGSVAELTDTPIRTGFRAMDDSAEAGYYAHQILRLARGLEPEPGFSALLSAGFLIRHEIGKALEKKFRF